MVRFKDASVHSLSFWQRLTAFFAFWHSFKDWANILASFTASSSGIDVVFVVVSTSVGRLFLFCIVSHTCLLSPVCCFNKFERTFLLLSSIPSGSSTSQGQRLFLRFCRRFGYIDLVVLFCVRLGMLFVRRNDGHYTNSRYCCYLGRGRAHYWWIKSFVGLRKEILILRIIKYTSFVPWIWTYSTTMNIIDSR